MNLDGFLEVEITDNTDFDPQLCSNGGKYSYTTHYYRFYDDMDKWAISYETSSEFKFCDTRGEFCNRECEGCPYCDDYKIVSTEDVIKAIESVENDKNFFVMRW